MIGPLTETRRRTIKVPRLLRSVCVVVALRRRGAITVCPLPPPPAGGGLAEEPQPGQEARGPHRVDQVETQHHLPGAQ